MVFNLKQHPHKFILMKKLLFILLSLLSFASYAQKIEITEDDAVMLDGKEIGTIESIGEDDGVVYTFLNTKGDEIMNAQMSDTKKNVFVLTFGDIETEAYVQKAQNMRMVLIKEILKNKILVNDELNEQNARAYCSKTAGKAPRLTPAEKAVELKEKKDAKDQAKQEEADEKEFSLENDVREKPTEAPKQAANTKAANPLVAKKEAQQATDENVPIDAAASAVEMKVSVEGDVIYKDGQLVGRFRAITGTVEGKKGKAISIYSPEAKRIAMVKYQFGEHGATLTTAKDAKQQQIAFSATEEKEIIYEILYQVVELGYLK
jgi:hypothetical protein